MGLICCLNRTGTFHFVYKITWPWSYSDIWVGDIEMVSYAGLPWKKSFRKKEEENGNYNGILLLMGHEADLPL